MRDLIKHIVFEEFSKLTTLIEKDFSGNYKRKVNNFLLSQMDENITASMVFVSSFESKSGLPIVISITQGFTSIPKARS